MHVPAFHEAEHLARQPAHDQGLAIKFAAERIEGRHDVGDRAVAVQAGMRSEGLLRLGPHAGVRFAHHLLAEIDADQVILKEIVIEHVLGRLAEIDDPVGQRRRLDAEHHVLRVDGADGVIVAADAANPAGDEMGVTWVLALHEDAVAAKDRRRAAAFHDLAIGEINRGMDAQAADDAGDGVPGHVHEVVFLFGHLLFLYSKTALKAQADHQPDRIAWTPATQGGEDRKDTHPKWFPFGVLRNCNQDWAQTKPKLGLNADYS